MPKKGLTLGWKIVAANTLLAIFAVVLVVMMEFRKDRTLLEATIRRELGQTVAAGGLLLQGTSAVALIQGADTAQARKVTQKLHQLEQTNPEVSRLYVLGRGPQEQPRLLRGPAGLDESRFAPAVQQRLTEALDREVPVQTPVYEDADGQQWISAFHPIRDYQGRVVAVLGADFRARELKLEARHKLRSTLISASGAVVLAILLSLFMTRSITKPLKLMAESTSEIASGNLNICLNLRSQDEIGELADSFNRMVERLAASAEERDRLSRELMEKQKLEQELNLAAVIQQSFLPMSFPWSPRFHTNARSVPASVVGGDFYDFLDLDGDRVGMVIGDVAGRGIAAALYMARLISDFRAAAHRTPSPRETLERLNQQLLARSTRGLFVTMAYMVLDPASGELCYSSGGHLPALRRDGRTHRVELLGDDQGLPLGISAWPELKERRLQLEPQDALLWVTDGIVEGLSDRAVDFRLDPLLGLFQRCRSSDDKIVDVIFDEVGRVSGSRPPEDDMTVLFLAWRPRPAGPV